MHNNERVLITFSAGVTRYIDGESQEDTIERADHAMYEAKKAGKNQVIVD
ncbi:GGDEF domain-containing protein [Chitinimonas sp.]